MGQVFAAFGIDWRILIINTINFALLLVILWKYLFVPLMRVLEKRRQKIAQGVHDADAAAAKLALAEEERKALLAHAGKEADDVLAKARAAALQKERELIASGEAASAAILSDAQLQAAELKAQSLEESKQEVAKLIVLGIEKAITQRHA